MESQIALTRLETSLSTKDIIIDNINQKEPIIFIKEQLPYKVVVGLNGEQ